MIDEAMLLCKLLTENKNIQQPEAFALMALMCFHSSRISSRLNDAGEIILLSQQDRSKWNCNLITEGNDYLNKAAFGDKISSYHIEAAIAYEHCIAETFDTTNWQKILELYDWLCKLNPSVITEINRAVVILKLHGAASALAALNKLKESSYAKASESKENKFQNYYLYHSLLGEIYREQNNNSKAKTHYEKAIELTRSDQEKKLLREKISVLFN